MTPMLTELLGQIVEGELTPQQLLLLALIAEHGALRNKAAAGLLGVDSPRISQLAGLLWDCGYIDRQHDPDDLRGVQYVPTDEGRAVIERLIRRIAAPGDETKKQENAAA